MPRFFLLLLLTAHLTACSLYSSAGRKQFEEKAPSNIIQTYAFLGCRNLGVAETWIKEEFLSATSELVDMTPDYEVWSKPLRGTSMEITVLSKPESSDQSGTQSCVYEFSSLTEWNSHKKAFLMELSNNTAELD